jgi:glycine/D-amino acid oxidase-like deaminating enzyme
MHSIDYLIIGQGLAGSALAWELRHRGKTVMVIDEPEANRSSAIAAGLFNPITGRVMTKTWMADQLFPALNEFYTTAVTELGQDFFHPRTLYRPFVSAVEQHQWKQKAADPSLQSYVLKFHDAPQWPHQVKNSWGGIEIAQCGYVDTNLWMEAIRTWLIQSESFSQARFEEQEVRAGVRIQYKDIDAGAIIYCNGMGASDSQCFGWLPLKPLKGQTLRITTPETLERIYSRGVFMVPSGNEYVVGATYEHPPFTTDATPEGRQVLTDKLDGLLNTTFQVVHQDWGIRPTTPDRRPLLGQHPDHKNVWVFNGLGTKGVSLAPYFARQLSDRLLDQADLLPAVNISRFYTLYSGSR